MELQINLNSFNSSPPYLYSYTFLCNKIKWMRITRGVKWFRVTRLCCINFILNIFLQIENLKQILHKFNKKQNNKTAKDYTNANVYICAEIKLFSFVLLVFVSTQNKFIWNCCCLCGSFFLCCSSFFTQLKSLYKY